MDAAVTRYLMLAGGPQGGDPLSDALVSLSNAVSVAAASSTSGTAPPVPLLFKPGVPATPGVFPTQAALVTAAAPFVAKGIPLQIAIDDSVAAATITGIVTLSNYSLVSGRADNYAPNLIIAAGSGFTSAPTLIDSVRIDNNALTVGQSVFPVEVNQNIVLRNANLANLGVGSMFLVSAGATFTADMYGESDLSGGTPFAIASTGAGTSVILSLYDFSLTDKNSVGGTGTNQIFMKSSASLAELSPAYTLKTSATGLYKVTKTISLAQLAAPGGVATAAIPLGAALPPTCNVVGVEIKVVTALAATAVPGLTARGSVEATVDPLGALLGVTDLTVAGVSALPGSSPYFTRDGQQLQVTVSLGGGPGAFLNALTAGAIEVTLLVLLTNRVGPITP